MSERLTADGDVVTKLSAQSVRDAAAKAQALHPDIPLGMASG